MKTRLLILVLPVAALSLSGCVSAPGQPRAALPRFSHPREITNPWLPLAALKQDVLEGTEDGKPLRVERTVKPDLTKRFNIGGQSIDALVIEDREFSDGQLSEITLDYFAQADDGGVYYLGEDVDEYRNGRVTGHSGAWLLGVHTKHPGLLMPGVAKPGDKFKSEDVPRVTTEDDEIVSISETVTVPAGTFQNCLKIKELASDGATEFKYYALGIGCIREVPSSGDLVLKSHAVK